MTNSLVTNPAVFPGKTHNNDTACIDGRVIKVMNNINPPKIYYKYAHEFVNHLVPKNREGRGFPISVSEVIAIQNKAMQKARSERASATMSITSHNQLKSFIKGEAYSGTTDPRNITTCSADLTISMSSFTLSEKEDILKLYDWFGPCKTPEQTVSVLRNVCDVDEVMLTDYSRFDGTISEFLQNAVVRASSLRWCHPNERENYEQLYSRVFIRRAITNTGLRYDPGWGTRSGSPITSDGNTKINGFISYCAYRETGLNPLKAWDQLCKYAIKCGDDGVEANIPGLSTKLGKVCEELGLKLKAEVVNATGPITYCGRIFPSLKTLNSSYQDPIRTIPKLHLSANSSITKMQAAHNKAMGYYITDKDTPIIGTWAKRVLEITKHLSVKNPLNEEIYRYNCAWPQGDKDLIRESLAYMMDLTLCELEKVEKQIIDSVSLEDFPVVIDNVVDHKIDAIIGDNIVGPTNVILDNKSRCPMKNKTKINMNLMKPSKDGLKVQNQHLNQHMKHSLPSDNVMSKRARRRFIQKSHRSPKPNT